jgi:hypothetical protein
MESPSAKPIEVVRYSPDLKDQWDACVSGAVNQHLLFYRNYMDYHSDRFADHSLMAFRDGSLVGVLPANESKGTLYSHQGLTFGGFLHGPKLYAADALAFVAALRAYMRAQSLARLICKPAPFAYVSVPCEAMQYALYCAGARILERHLSTAIDFRNPLPMSELRRRGVKKALKAGVGVAESEDWDGFLAMLAQSLARHGVAPKHTADELALLHGRFPEHVRLVAASSGGVMLAGVLLYLTNSAAHTQYISVSPEGQRVGALDLLMHTLIEEQRPLRQYFCFGVSTEDDGRVLNHGLQHQKEGFGGRAMLHDIFELEA